MFNVHHPPRCTNTLCAYALLPNFHMYVFICIHLLNLPSLFLYLCIFCNFLFSFFSPYFFCTIFVKTRVDCQGRSDQISILWCIWTAVATGTKFLHSHYYLHHHHQHHHQHPHHHHQHPDHHHPARKWFVHQLRPTLSPNTDFSWTTFCSFEQYLKSSSPKFLIDIRLFWKIFEKFHFTRQNSWTIFGSFQQYLKSYLFLAKIPKQYFVFWTIFEQYFSLHKKIWTIFSSFEQYLNNIFFFIKIPEQYLALLNNIWTMLPFFTKIPEKYLALYKKSEQSFFLLKIRNKNQSTIVFPCSCIFRYIND